jgi:hypothetical protein
MSQYPEVEHLKDGKSRLGGYGDVYFRFSEASYSQFLKDRAAMESASDEFERDEFDNGAFEHGVKTIVFAALSVEASINDYGAWQLGDSYFEDHLNALDVLSKWVVVPRLVCGKEMNKGSAAYSRLVSLIRARHQLIHNKSREFNPHDPELPKLLETRTLQFEAQVHNAYRALLLLSLEFDYLLGPMYNPLRSLDRKVSPCLTVPANLVEVHAECKDVAARHRRRNASSIE